MSSNHVKSGFHTALKKLQYMLDFSASLFIHSKHNLSNKRAVQVVFHEDVIHVESAECFVVKE